MGLFPRLLELTQVPRVQQGDVLKVKLLNEQVSGLKLDQTMWDWTFLVTFINPLRRMTNSLDGKSLKEKHRRPKQNSRSNCPN